MDASVQGLIGMAALAVMALAASAAYRWRQRGRVRLVEAWVKDYLVDRYGGLPPGLSVNCSDDTHWPVLVDFDDPLAGARHRLQFACPGLRSAFLVLSEKEDDPPRGAPSSKPGPAAGTLARAGQGTLSGGG